MFQWQQEKYECDFFFGPMFNSIWIIKEIKKALENYD